LTTFDVKKTSHTKVWWKCKKDHSWEAKVSNRHNGRGCPYCAGQKICEDNCLAAINPELVKEWHPTKNGDLTPSDVMPSTARKKIWWVCVKGHEWRESPNKRNSGDDCPYCSNHRVCSDNCLATIDPVLAKEWHPTKNEITPSDVTSRSGKRAWWICSKGHEWDAIIGSRARGNGCSRCLTKTEEKCRKIFENIFGKPFYKDRKALGCNLELDGYCEELKLAFEYNGAQHYKFVKFWHKTADSLAKQQERDRRKARLCKEKGIKLITIPYTENDRLEEFIETSVIS